MDQSYEKTTAARQFFGSIDCAASASVFGHVNLQVVSGSAAVRSLGVQSSIAGRVAIATSTAAGTANPVGAGGNANKLLGGPAPAFYRGQLGYSAGLGPNGSEIPGYTIRQFIYVPANQTVQVPLTTPLVVSGGFGLVVSAYASNRDISAVIEVEEFS